MAEHEVDKGRRRFLIAATSLLGSIGAIFAAVPFISAWFPTARARALGAPVEVDLTKVPPGEMITVAWRGKPIWVVHRTKEMLALLTQHNNLLRDPFSKVDQQPPYAKNIYRSIKPDYAILIGICTHLGCIPTYKPKPGEMGADWPGGFYCPCHGSFYDLSGRVYKGVPAPINLEVPPYRYSSNTEIVIGENPKNV